MRRTWVYAVAASLVLAACGSSKSPYDPITQPTATTVAPAVPGRYEVTTTVLQDRRHGPQLCLGGVLDSLPPQCGGIDVVGLRWGTTPGAHSVNGTTWAEVHVVGTYDGHRFTLSQPPTAPAPNDRPSAPAPHFPQLCEQPTGENRRTAPIDFQAGNEIPGLVSVWVTGPGTATPGPRYVVNVTVRPGYEQRATQAIRRSYPDGLCVVEKDAPPRATLERVQSEVVALPASSPLGSTWSAYIDETRSVVVVQVSVATETARRYAQKRWGPLVELHSLLTPVR